MVDFEACKDRDFRMEWRLVDVEDGELENWRHGEGERGSERAKERWRDGTMGRESEEVLALSFCQLFPIAISDFFDN